MLEVFFEKVETDSEKLEKTGEKDYTLHTVRCPIICSFCGITILRFTFYAQSDGNRNFTEKCISMASVFHQNMITDSD